MNVERAAFGIAPVKIEMADRAGGEVDLLHGALFNSEVRLRDEEIGIIGRDVDAIDPAPRMIDALERCGRDIVSEHIPRGGGGVEIMACLIEDQTARITVIWLRQKRIVRRGYGEEAHTAWRRQRQVFPIRTDRKLAGGESA